MARSGHVDMASVADPAITKVLAEPAGRPSRLTIRSTRRGGKGSRITISTAHVEYETKKAITRTSIAGHADYVRT